MRALPPRPRSSIRSFRIGRQETEATQVRVGNGRFVGRVAPPRRAGRLTQARNSNGQNIAAPSHDLSTSISCPGCLAKFATGSI